MFWDGPVLELRLSSDGDLSGWLIVSIISVLIVIRLVSIGQMIAASKRIVISARFVDRITEVLSLIVCQKRVLLKVLESILLDILKRKMSLILNAQLLIALCAIIIILVWCVFVIRVILLKGLAGCLVYGFELLAGRRMLFEKVLFETLVLFAHVIIWSSLWKNWFDLF